MAPPPKNAAWPPFDLRAEREAIKTDKAKPVYLLLGDDRFLKERLVQELCAHAGEGTVQLRARGPQELLPFLEQLNTASLWGGRIVGLLQQAEQIAGAGKPMTARLLRYVEKPALWAHLVIDFDDSALTAPARALRAALANRCPTFQCGALKPDQARRWIAQRLGKVDAAVADYLWQHTQGRPQILDRELQKLELLTHDPQPITLDECRLLVTSDKEDEPFELTNAIEEYNPERAVRALHKALDHGQDPLMLLGALARFARSLLLVAAATERGDTPEHIARQFGMHPFRVKVLLGAARGGTRRVGRTLAAVAAADARLKRGGEPRLILERLVSGMAWGGKQGR